MRTRGNKTPRWPFVLPILILAGVILFFFWKLAFSNLILARGDTFLYFYPYWQAAAEAMRDGRVPLWNPDIFMGAPLLANSQVGFFYPLNWPVWLLMRTPYAVKATVLIHTFIAGLGTYIASRKVMLVGRTASLVAAISFSLGGYFSAQLEHVNQIQGLAWLPWFLIGLSLSESPNRYRKLLSFLVMAALFSLQLLAGHTQTTFITGVGLIIWQLSRVAYKIGLREQNGDKGRKLRWRYFEPFGLLMAAILLASLITAVQLLPTWELSQLSSRQGGLPVNEVLSFSLPPLLLARSLLPAFNQSLFSEYVAFLPLLFLSLAFIAAWQWRKMEVIFPALVWLIFGIILALGVFNPLNWLLARLPLFNLFRAPARWLILYALGASLLAGVGAQLIINLIRKRDEQDSDYSQLVKRITRPLMIFLAAALLLTMWDILGQFFKPLLPTGPEAPFEPPTVWTTALRFIEWLFLAGILLMITKGVGRRLWRWIPGAWLILGVVILFISSRALPYNSLTTPEAFFDLRPSVSRLIAETKIDNARFLSLSKIFFDAGDQAEIDSIYQDQLPADARYDYTIAVKQKEIIAPNLSMIYSLPAVDGFDGGILPTQIYSRLTGLILPEGEESTDGRLRENLEQVPEEKWLDLFNAKYLVTDKVGDLWRNGVFFDRQHTTSLEPGQEITVASLPDYEATNVQVLASTLIGPLTVTTLDGQEWELGLERIEEGLFAADFPQPAKLADIRIGPCSLTDSCQLEAVTLVDQRDQTFQSLVPGQYQLIHSGDVKIYENLDVLPRAFMVYDWQWAGNLDEAIKQMDLPDFDPSRTAVLISPGSNGSNPDPGEGDLPSSSVEILDYDPERVVLIVKTNQDGYLILTDSDYPSWNASVNGQEQEIIQADGLFRGILLPAGRHEVVFYLTSQSYNVGRAISLGGLIIASLLIILLRRLKKGSNQ